MLLACPWISWLFRLWGKQSVGGYRERDGKHERQGKRPPRESLRGPHLPSPPLCEAHMCFPRQRGADFLSIVERFLHPPQKKKKSKHLFQALFSLFIAVFGQVEQMKRNIQLGAFA